MDHLCLSQLLKPIPPVPFKTYIAAQQTFLNGIGSPWPINLGRWRPAVGVSYLLLALTQAWLASEKLQALANRHSLLTSVVAAVDGLGG